MKPRNDVRQHIEEPLPILGIEEDVLPGVAAGGDMVEGSWKLDAQGRAMGRRLAHQKCT